jgi:hypothetical protein
VKPGNLRRAAGSLGQGILAPSDPGYALQPSDPGYALQPSDPGYALQPQIPGHILPPPKPFFPPPIRTKPGPNGHLDPCDGVVWMQSGASLDADLTGIGGSPYRGDLGATGVVIPSEATTGQDNRYLARLAVVTIPSGSAVVIRGLMQVATIRALVPTSVDISGEAVAGPTIPFEREVVSPFWKFPNGNISWHLRWKQTKAAADVHDPAQVAGTSPKIDGMDAALLYSQLVPYVTLRGGIPPGRAVGDLGTFRDMRWPWGNTDWGLNHLIMGPGQVALYASVFQPDRSIWTVENSDGTEGTITLTSNEGMRPEDQFLANFGPANVFYGRVAGAIIYEPFPCCEDAMKGHL